MPDYIDLPITTDPEALAADAFAYLQAQYPGWQPVAGALDTILIEALCREAAQVRDVASRVPTAIFRRLGQLAGIAPLDAASATVASTWTLRDTLGHTIDAGTQVAVRAADGTLVPFRVAADVTVSPGASATAAGAVTLAAVEAGAAGSGLGTVGSSISGGGVVLLDTLDFVSNITLAAATSGGVDAEADETYLNRLAGRLQVMSPRAILPRDYAILARDITPVDRALVIDGWDPGAGTGSHERTVAVYPIDAAGADLSGPAAAALDAYLQSLREVNFLVYVANPTRTVVDVTYALTALVGFELADLEARVDAAITLFLSPARWGLPATGDRREWLNTTVVRYLEVAQAINDVEGVDYITTLTIGLNGGAQTAADHTLTGAAPLPTPGVIAGTVTGP